MYIELMQKIINEKYNELKLNKIDESQPFWKSSFFEGNAIGQIGHNFLIKVLDKLQIPHNNQKDGNHDEYDLVSNNKKIEIKTARKGQKNTCQFNGLNPDYNYDFVFCLGIANDSVRYKIIKKTKGNFFYDHSKRGHFVKYMVNDVEKIKKLVDMNPNNKVNKKLTLNWNEMQTFENFIDEIKNYLEVKNM